MTARTVLHSNGKPSRAVLRQPPHYRTGIDAPQQPDAAERGADRAINASSSERQALWRTTGTRVAK